MITEIVGVAIAFTLGWLCLRMFAPATGYAFVMSAAFPIGLALWVMTSMALVAVMIPFNPVTGLLLAGLVVIICNLVWGTRPSRYEFLKLMLGAACIVSATLLFAAFEWTNFNADTRWTLHMADNLIDSGFISPPMRQTQIGAEPIYLPMVSAYARWFGEVYFVSLSPLMLACTGALIAVCGSRAAKSYDGLSSALKMWLPVLGAVALITTGFYVINALQTKTHGVYAFHMLGACAALYFAGRERRTAWLFAALLFTAPMVLMRLESGVSALPILVVAVAIPTLPLRKRLFSVGIVAIAWGLSYAYLLGANIYSSDSGMFDRSLLPMKLLYIGSIPGLFGAALILTALVIRFGKYEALLDRLVSLLPAVMISALFTILVGHMIVRPEAFWISMGGFKSILTSPSMGGIGYGITILVLLSASLIVRPKIPWLWTVMIPTVSYIFFLMLADIHLDGFPHWGQTGAITRISSHVLPTLFFYVLLRLVASDENVRSAQQGLGA